MRNGDGSERDRSQARGVPARTVPIVIVGLGLIGGSLAAACRKKFPRAKIIGVTRNRAALSRAKKKKWIHEGFRDLGQAFVGVPLAGARGKFRGQTQGLPLPRVILCTPVDTLKDYLKRIDRLAPEGTIVTDTGSVKGFLVRWADRQNWRRIRFVGAHPMAGSHERGIDAARPDLFEGSITFVTPGRRTRRAVGAAPRGRPEGRHRGLPLPLVTNFWKRICDRVVILSPEEHDRLTAEVSHLPHLLASILVTGVSSEALRYAASGFLDTTRVAEGDPSLWVPILLENRKELARSLFDFESGLRRIKKILRKGDLPRLRQILSRAQKRRSALGAPEQ